MLILDSNLQNTHPEKRNTCEWLATEGNMTGGVKGGDATVTVAMGRDCWTWFPPTIVGLARGAEDPGVLSDPSEMTEGLAAAVCCAVTNLCWRRASWMRSSWFSFCIWCNSFVLSSIESGTLSSSCVSQTCKTTITTTRSEKNSCWFQILALSCILACTDWENNKETLWVMGCGHEADLCSNLFCTVCPVKSVLSFPKGEVAWTYVGYHCCSTWPT